jgi:hypothetical protein
MMKAVFLVLGLILSTGASAAAVDPFQGPQPIAVLLETNPWLMVVGSDTPRVVIYADGQVVYVRQEKNQPAVYLHKQLTGEELEKTKKDLASFGDYSAVKRHYDQAPNITDLPETRIYLNLDGHAMVTSVYGMRAVKTPVTGASANSGRRFQIDEVPASVQGLYTYLAGLKFADATIWKPRYVEVMIWGYSYAPQQSIHWPKEWPGLESPETVRRGDAYSIFMPGSEIKKLNDFLSTRKEKGAVEIGGKKWAVSYRYVFPGEPAWAQAFREKPGPSPAM